MASADCPMFFDDGLISNRRGSGVVAIRSSAQCHITHLRQCSSEDRTLGLLIARFSFDQNLCTAKMRMYEHRARYTLSANSISDSSTCKSVNICFADSTKF